MVKNKKRYLVDPSTVSLEQIKQETLGRSIQSIYDCTLQQPTETDALDQTTETDARPYLTKLAGLRNDLSCTVCRDLLYNPTSLLCGHSCCQVCLKMWLSKSKSCPICRAPVNDEASTPQVNVALKAVLDLMYSSEVSGRRQREQVDKAKMQRGEMGGLHTRGYEEQNALIEEDEMDFLHKRMSTRTTTTTKIKKTTTIKTADEGTKGPDEYGCIAPDDYGWIALVSFFENHSSDSSECVHWDHRHGLMIRRNTVLDETDQRYQCSLALIKCTYAINQPGELLGKTIFSPAVDTVDSRGVLEIILCLVQMEEDEVLDSGFPPFVVWGTDNEHLVDLTTQHSFIQPSARVVSMPVVEGMKPIVKEVLLPKEKFGRDGTVKLSIDVAKILDEATVTNNPSNVVVKMRFVHDETGAVLELRLPSRGETDIILGSNGGLMVFGTPQNGSTTCVLQDGAEEEELGGDHNLNGYEDDGFVVSSSPEHSLDPLEHDTEGGACEICHDYGDMIVCDGCELDYHVQCIGRKSIPEGELAANTLTVPKYALM